MKYTFTLLLLLVTGIVSAQSDPDSLLFRNKTLFAHWLEKAWAGDTSARVTAEKLDSAVTRAGHFPDTTTDAMITWQAKALILRSQWWFAPKTKDRSLEDAETALWVADSVNRPDLMRRSLDLLVEWHRQFGTADKALYYQSKAFDLERIAWEAQADSTHQAALTAAREQAEEGISSAENAMHLQQKETFTWQAYTLAAAALAVAALVIVIVLLVLSKRRSAALTAVTAEAEEARRKLAEHEEQLSSTRQQGSRRDQDIQRLRALIDTQEKERQLLGHQLADGVGQGIATARQNLDALGKEAGNAMPVERFVGLQRSLSRAAHDLRHLVSDLTAEGLEQHGLGETLRALCARLSNEQLLVTFEARGTMRSIGPFEDAQLYRIVGEMLQNTVRHSGATQAKVILVTEPRTIQVVVEDNGSGFDPKTRLRAGRGIAAIQARAAFLGARIDVETGQGKGTSYRLTIGG